MKSSGVRSTINRHLESNEMNIIAPMPGKVIKILVSEGEQVTKGQTVIILSAMKMESEYKAPADGTIGKVNVTEGDTVEGNQVLIEII